jgi:RNA polymerase sigma-70 factor (ECF subfamily)
MVSQELSFSALAAGLRDGDAEAAAHVFRRYARRLIAVAARRLDPVIRERAGPEDVVQSVFRSFFTRQQAGQFELATWDSLWDVLVLITVRKCCNRAAYFRAARRDVRREFAVPAHADAGAGWEALDREPTPEEAAQLAETTEDLLAAFDAPERAVVELRLQGHEILEICAALGCSERKVYRVLQRARQELRRRQAADEVVA